MAIAPSKLGQFVALHWSGDDSLLLNLRALGLVIPDAPDEANEAARLAWVGDSMGYADGCSLYNNGTTST